MIIYKATIEDARFLYENLKVLRVGVEYSFEIFSEYYFNYLNNKNNTIYIGRIDNNYIGFITVNIYSSIKYIGYTAELEEVVICEKYRGQGKGKVILQRVIELLGEEKDIRKVIVKTDDLKIAGKLYSKFLGKTEMITFQKFLNKI